VKVRARGLCLVEDQERLAYRTAERVLDPAGHPQKRNLLHFSVSLKKPIRETRWPIKERQARLHEVIREG
jgi:hypothetical protein